MPNEREASLPDKVMSPPVHLELAVVQAHLDSGVNFDHSPSVRIDHSPSVRTILKHVHKDKEKHPAVPPVVYTKDRTIIMSLGLEAFRSMSKQCDDADDLHASPQSHSRSNSLINLPPHDHVFSNSTITEPTYQAEKHISASGNAENNIANFRDDIREPDYAPRPNSSAITMHNKTDVPVSNPGK